MTGSEVNAELIPYASAADNSSLKLPETKFGTARPMLASVSKKEKMINYSIFTVQTRPSKVVSVR